MGAPAHAFGAILLTLMVACGGGSGGAARSPTPGSRPPESYSVYVAGSGLDHLPAPMIRAGDGRFTLGAFRDEPSWRGFASAAGIDVGTVRVDFGREQLVFVGDTQSVAGQIQFYAWLPEGPGQGLLLIQPHSTELAIINGANLVLVVVERERLRSVRLGWVEPIDELDPDPIDDESALPFRLVGGTDRDTLELPLDGHAPAATKTLAFATAWRSVAFPSMGASGTIPQRASIQTAGPGNVVVKLPDETRVWIRRIHADEGLAIDLPEIAEDVASGRCKVLEEGEWSTPTKAVPTFSVTECASEAREAPPTTKVRAEVRDVLPQVGFHCEAVLAGMAPARDQTILHIHRLCGSIETSDPKRACPGLPASLTSPEQENGFVAGGRPQPGWFARDVRWDDRPIAGAAALRRAQDVGLQSELSEAFAQPDLACAFAPGGAVQVVTKRCEVRFELSSESRSGPLWNIASVSCS
jgi:hypothetical protein